VSDGFRDYFLKIKDGVFSPLNYRYRIILLIRNMLTRRQGREEKYSTQTSIS